MMLSRRHAVKTLAAGATLGLIAPARAHNDAGAVTPPEAPPGVELTMHDGTPASLAKVLTDRVTALQLIFTSCGMTCPIQGAVFAAAAKELGDRIASAQWLSITIDPPRDDPKTLSAWMARFGAHPRWRAARPDPPGLEKLLAFLRARTNGPDRHTAQVYFFDRRARLTMRSVDFPPSHELLRVLGELDKRS
ncbi:MAG: SCO family protein [Polyangiaceae bacterium]|jgi:protein SCO1/2|nr:SCO family protein [Polyangiaceae bacterium]